MFSFKKLKVITTCFSFCATCPIKLLIIIILGILTALSESIGISFFIPLLENSNQSSQTVNLIDPYFNNIFYGLSSQTQQLVLLSLIFFAILFKTLFSYTNNVFIAKFKANMGHNLRSLIFERIVFAPLIQLDKYQSGKLLNILATDSWRVGDAFMIFLNIITDILTATVFVAVMLWMSWKLTLFSTCSLVFISSFLIWNTRSITRKSKEAVDVNNALAELMHEGVDGLHEIRLYNNGRQEMQSFEAISDKVRHAFFSLDAMAASVLPIHEMLSIVLTIAILGVSLVAKQFSLPAALAFIFILYRLQPRIRQLESHRIAISSAWGSLEQVSAILALQPHEVIFAYTGNTSLIQPLNFQNVSFAYPGQNQPVFNQLNFSIETGKTTAIIGPSGAGKTTLLKLLSQLYVPTSGEILVGETPLDFLGSEIWGKRVVVVPQKPHIFHASVWDNIAYGYPRATQNEVEFAAYLADAEDFIQELPDGYNTIIGGRDAHISGGQCQRITLARALIRNPDVVILDEPTNALDGISSQNVSRALQKWGQNRTVVIVAHNMETIQHADTVLLLDRGVIRPVDNFHMLYESEGYAVLEHLLSALNT